MTPIEEKAVRVAHRYPRALWWLLIISAGHLLWDVARAYL